MVEEEQQDEHSKEEDDDLFKEIEIKVDPGQEPLRIDKFLINRLGDGISRNRIQNAAKAGSLFVGTKAVKSNYKVRPGDHVKLIIPSRRGEYKLEGEDIPLEIPYEDDAMLIVNKPAGLVVHPGISNWSGTLVNGLIYHFKNLPVKAQSDRPGIVHRLDKDTSGLIVIAKTEYAMTHLAKQFYERSIQRKYYALVWGDVIENEGRIEGNIGRDPRHRKQMYVFEEGDQGKHAVTNYRVIERFGYTTMVECKLETGRTHQIRVHMKHLGHPVFNDSTYGGDKIVKGTVFTKYKQFVDNCFKIMRRQALHAKTIGFTHPESKKEMFFESELPEDFAGVVEKWRGYAKHKM
ncbi:MAG: RluA family pseudouridine synthase [Chitinophagales bacterium]|nr:RluA family pseudouridine synthase [Chitinophagales bacterium]